MIRLVLLISALALAAALDFDCTTLLPRGRSRGEAEHTTPFGMILNTSPTYRPGDTVRVHVRSASQRFSKFVVQGRRPLDDTARGQFVQVDQNSMLYDCINAGDTVTSRDNVMMKNFTVTWRVPHNMEDSPEIEFDVGIAEGEKFWIFNTMIINVDDDSSSQSDDHPTANEERAQGKVNIPDDDVKQSPEPTEDPGTGEDPNEPERLAEEEREEADRRDHVGQNDMHDPRTEADLAREAELRKQKEIEEEDKYSEGEWQKLEEEERKKHEEEMHEEEIEYERLQAEEEEERRRRMQFEIRDKEEHDIGPEEPQGGDIGDIDLGDPEGRPLTDL